MSWEYKKVKQNTNSEVERLLRIQHLREIKYTTRDHHSVDRQNNSRKTEVNLEKKGELSAPGIKSVAQSGVVPNTVQYYDTTPSSYSSCRDVTPSFTPPFMPPPPPSRR